MKSLIIVTILMTLLPSSFAAETRSWSGKWNNRKYGTSGPLKCVGQSAMNGKWTAVFSGTFKGDPFEYRVQFVSRKAGSGEALAGKATVSGHPYEWTGGISARQLRGSYRSTNGNNGTFVLRESVSASTPTPPTKTRGRSRTSRPTAGIRDGETFLFIGNSFMANEGGVFSYFAKAVKTADNISVDFDKHINYGRPLSAMLKPEVGRSIASQKFDTIVFTSGQLSSMRKFIGDIDKAGKRAVVFMTWELRHPGNRATEAQYTAATRKTVGLMRRLQQESDVVVIPAVVVYHDLTLRPPSEMPRPDYLWHEANIHQNELGTLVNAWTVYAVLAGKSPVGLDLDVSPYVVAGKLKSMPDFVMTADVRSALQARVGEVVQAWKSGRTHLE